MQKSHKVLYVLRQMVHRYFSDGISQASAELAYFLLFSFFPLLMFLNSVLGSIALSAQVLNRMHTFLPSSLSAMIQGYLEYVGGMSSVRPMVIGGLLTMFFLSRAMRSLLRTVNRLYRVPVRVRGAAQMLLSLLLTIIFLGAIVASFAVVVIGRTIARFAATYLPISPTIQHLSQIGGYWIAIALVLAFLLLFNRIVPNVELHWHNAVPGTVFSAVVWGLLSMGFSFYVDNMASYSLLYGSLGAMIVLMLWLYLMGMVILMGAQLNHILWSMKQCNRGKNTDDR